MVEFANDCLALSTVVTHTETPPALRGRGIASELVQDALELIRADGLKAVAGCGFVADYLRKRPEYTRIWYGDHRPSRFHKLNVVPANAGTHNHRC